MRRAPIVLTTTVAGTVGLLGFQAREPALPTAAAATAPAPTAPTPAPVSPPPAAGAGTASISGTFDGEAVDTRYGAAQVRVTLADGKITEIEALQLQGNERKSVEISSRAAPELRVSALSRRVLSSMRSAARRSRARATPPPSSPPWTRPDSRAPTASARAR